MTFISAMDWNKRAPATASTAPGFSFQTDGICAAFVKNDGENGFHCPRNTLIYIGVNRRGKLKTAVDFIDFAVAF